MLKPLAIALALIASAPALADGLSYLPQPDVATATARSVAEGVAMGIPDGSPWWNVSTLQCTAGPAVFIVFEPAAQSTYYDFTISPINPKTGAATGLSDAEKLLVLTDTALAAQQGCAVISWP